MTLFLDSTALLALHIDGASRSIVVDAMNDDAAWVASALALPEAIAAATRLTEEETLRRIIEDGIRHTWDFLHVIPVDQALCDEAAHLCAQQPVGMSTALHLASATRLPSPVRLVTFDAAQIPVALSLGLEVHSG